jgi:DNA excision repair protein ERCC-2
LPHGARALNRLHITLRKLAKREALAMAPEHVAHPGELDLFPVESPNARSPRLPAPDEMNSRFTDQDATTIARLEFPEELIAPLDAALQTMEIELARNQPAPYREPLLDLYFRLHAFRRSADLYDERFATLIQSSPSVQVRLLCLNPSFLLRQALDRGKSAIFFSATLAPMDYYQSLLGGSPEDPRLQLPSPFAPEHLAVLVHDRIRTQLRSRAGSLDEVVGAIGALVEGRRGNYLVYFPSYQYLEVVRTRFQALHPDLPTLAQHSGMTEAERESFLAAFSTEPETHRIGFAVLGGIFGEGIDLVGDRLLGAVIVGVGLPQVCPERDLIRNHFSSQTGGGFDYAYTFPGMNRVLQAIGRVIRSETDRGIVLLLDARFGQAKYRRLFPPWWQPVRVINADEIRSAVRAYWNASS